MDWTPLRISDSVHYGKNLSLLLQRYPRFEQWREKAELNLSQLEIAPAGEVFLCRGSAGMMFYDPVHFKSQLQQVADRVSLSFQQGKDLVIFCGTGLGYVSSHIEETIRGDFGKGIVLVENRPELVLAQMALFDCEMLIKSTQVYWAVGEDIYPALEELANEERLFCVAESKLAAMPERMLNPRERAEFQAVPSWFVQYKRSTLGEAEKKYSLFQAKMEQPADLETGTIWAIATPDAYAHTPLMRSLMSGFEETGWTKCLVELRDGYSTRFKVSESLIENSPDLVLVCNSASGTFVSDTVKRPRLVWLLDHPRYFGSDSLSNDIGPLDHVVYCDRTYSSYFQNSKAASHQFIPVTPMVIRKGERREEPAAPIVFVGSNISLDSLLQHFPAKVRDEILLVLDYLSHHPAENAYKAFKKNHITDESVKIIEAAGKTYISMLQRTFPSDQIATEYFLYSLTNSYKREKIIRELLDFGIVIYGPDSWLSFLGDKYASQFRGWLPDTDLPDVYASAELCLNIHSLQCPTCLNCRDFDVLAAGGCLLTDWVDDMDRGYITPGEDCMLFHGVDELKNMVQRLLEDREKRERIRQKGHETYLQKHTPKHRAEEMLKILKSKLF